MSIEERLRVDDQEVSFACSRCTWTYAGLFAEGRDLFQRHREDTHPEFTYTPPKRHKTAVSRHRRPRLVQSVKLSGECRRSGCKNRATCVINGSELCKIHSEEIKRIVSNEEQEK